MLGKCFKKEREGHCIGRKLELFKCFEVWLLSEDVSGVDLMLSMSGCGQVFVEDKGHFERRLQAGHLHRLVTLWPLKYQSQGCRGESTFYQIALTKVEKREKMR